MSIARAAKRLRSRVQQMQDPTGYHENARRLSHISGHPSIFSSLKKRPDTRSLSGTQAFKVPLPSHFEIKTTKQDEPASFHLRTRSTVPSGEKPRREGSERVRRVKTRSRECSQPSHVHALPGLALMSKTIWYQFGPVALTTRPNGISNEVQMSRSFSDTFTLTLSTASSSFAACSKS